MPTTLIKQVSLTRDRIHQFKSVKRRIEREVSHPVSDQQALHVCFRAFLDSDMGPEILTEWRDRRRRENQ